MRYMLLIYTDERREAQLTPEQRQADLAEYFAFAKETGAAGIYLDGDELKSTASATTVRLNGGQTITTDGPYAETKEQLGGYFMLQCKDMDEATAWAAKLPGARHGSVEVRSIIEFN
jgi:hypothetical protein